VLLLFRNNNDGVSFLIWFTCEIMMNMTQVSNGECSAAFKNGKGGVTASMLANFQRSVTYAEGVSV
jgi:hypothetical protein